jgi:DNA-binding NarL/FixJ family response regulator
MSHHIIIIDDHPLLAAGLRNALAANGASVELLDPELGAEMVTMEIAARCPDCVVVDLGLPIPGGGQALIPAIVAGGTRVVVLTGETERWQWGQAVHAGAEAVVSKAEDLADIVEVIGRVGSGEPVRLAERAELSAEHNARVAERQDTFAAFETLSRREQEVLHGLMGGQSVQRLAERDFVSVQTVRTQVRSVLRKLGVSSQLEAVALANRAGWTTEQSAT